MFTHFLCGKQFHFPLFKDAAKLEKKGTMNAFNFNGLAFLLSFPPLLPARKEQISKTRLGNERAPREERMRTGIFLNKRLMHYHLNKVL